jgi:hypothetical protein
LGSGLSRIPRPCPLGLVRLLWPSLECGLGQVSPGRGPAADSEQKAM